MNKILKRNTTDEENLRYNVGGFKIVPNKIGLIYVINTSAPEVVENDLDELLNWYQGLKKILLTFTIDLNVFIHFLMRMNP